MQMCGVIELNLSIGGADDWSQEQEALCTADEVLNGWCCVESASIGDCI